MTTAAAPAPAADWAGVWRNRSNSVHVRTAACGAGLCGTVVWASPKAKAKVAAKGRTLVGTQLFRDFRRQKDGRWRGQVYVPDLGQTFAGTISFSGDTMVGEGCVIAGLICRSKTWTRLARR